MLCTGKTLNLVGFTVVKLRGRAGCGWETLQLFSGCPEEPSSLLEQLPVFLELSKGQWTGGAVPTCRVASCLSVFLLPALLPLGSTLCPRLVFAVSALRPPHFSRSSATALHC